MKAPGATVAALTSQQTDLLAWVRSLGATRSQSRALRRGTRTALIGNEDDFWVYAYSTGIPSEVAMVVVNGGGNVTNRTINTSALRGLQVSAWRTAVGTATSRVPSNTRNVEVSINAGEAAILVPSAVADSQ